MGKPRMRCKLDAEDGGVPSQCLGGRALIIGALITRIGFWAP